MCTVVVAIVGIIGMGVCRFVFVCMYEINTRVVVFSAT
jgi:hypothetical protein